MQNRAAKARREIDWLRSLQISHFCMGNRRKNKPTNFHRKYELRQLRLQAELVAVSLFYFFNPLTSVVMHGVMTRHAFIGVFRCIVV